MMKVKTMIAGAEIAIVSCMSYCTESAAVHF
mgnify:CR=1 FL=1